MGADQTMETGKPVRPIREQSRGCTTDPSRCIAKPGLGRTGNNAGVYLIFKVRVQSGDQPYSGCEQRG